jgi:16S rRNA (uracil1498-N3)-methyltransferase
LQVGSPATLSQAIAQLSEPALQAARWVLSLAPGTRSLQEMMQALNTSKDESSSKTREIILLSGPEGGLSPAEEAQAIAAGFVPVSLGNRVLRAETAPVAVLSALSCWD